MKIAILPGDGIGPEITKQAVNVLKALNLGAELVEAPIGALVMKSMEIHPRFNTRLSS